VSRSSAADGGGCRIRARRLRDGTPPSADASPEALEPYLADASGAPRGAARGLVRPSTEEEAAAFLRATLDRGLPILPQAARTSLTGGAIPRGEVVVSVERLRGLGPVEMDGAGARATFGAGVRLRELQAHVARAGFYYPAVPTHAEAMIGGTASTNAGAAASFKYGATRQWICGLRVLLFNGDLLEIERGQVVARPDQPFRVALADGAELTVPCPAYRLPDLKKVAAGYHTADPLDLVDLFVGAEGTLGLITAVRVALAPAPPALVSGLLFLADSGRAFDLAAELREAALAARRRRDSAGPDIRAIEWLDAGSLDLLRRHADARRRRVRLPDEARAGVLFEMELGEPTDDARARERLAAALDGGGDGRDDGLLRLFRLLRARGVLDDLDLAWPDDDRRRRELAELREAVPQRVNETLARRPGVAKCGGDLIVPFERLREMMRAYDDGFRRRGLEHAVWGHLGDGNLHPNALPCDARETELAQEALLEFAREAARLGGCPLAEHGVGRNPLKQRMLREFLGESALAQMRRVKRALDPPGRFAPGVLFSA
jgi:D-lactate dehydrogenase (cytochrome)